MMEEGVYHSGLTMTEYAVLSEVSLEVQTAYSYTAHNVYRTRSFCFNFYNLHKT